MSATGNSLLEQPHAALSLANNRVAKIQKLMAENDKTLERVALENSQRLNAEIVEFAARFEHFTKQRPSGHYIALLASLGLTATLLTSEVPQ
jgi:hypothetical protein